ncbi:ATP-binding cassette domain-containing protein [Streptomyces sp. NPDC006463]|uniref:ATP-binding cassette domain-containing protein n=1 Tax=Streptomyces sp. NPDC006463 TaxID=3364746 RepID=UPI00368FE0D2
MIEVRELTKRYGTRAAVDRLSFTAGPGTVTALLGPAGAGKTSALRLILGLDPTAGTANGGRRPAARSSAQPAPGRLPAGAETALHGRRMAGALLSAPAREQGARPGRVAEVLAETGLAREPRRRVRTYSPAMLQRLRIAAALLGDLPCCSSTNPSAGWTPKACGGRTGCCGLWPPRAGRSWSPGSAGEIAGTADRLVVLGRGRLVAALSGDGFAARRAAARVVVGSPRGADLAAVLRGRGATVVRSGAAGRERLAVTGMTANSPWLTPTSPASPVPEGSR